MSATYNCFACKAHFRVKLLIIMDGPKVVLTICFISYEETYPEFTDMYQDVIENERKKLTLSVNFVICLLAASLASAESNL